MLSVTQFPPEKKLTPNVQDGSARFLFLSPATFLYFIS